MKARLHTFSNLTVIAAVISAVFVWFYWYCIKNALPLSYEGDAFQVLLGIKGNANGENHLFSIRSFHELNAPFVGSWCDYPFEKILTWVAGLFSRWLGLAQGSTFTVLLLQVLAGVSFYGCGRWMRLGNESRVLLVACAILFGLAPYAFLQNLQHLTLTAYWHLSLLVLTLIWYGWPEKSRLTPRGGLIFGCCAGFIGGNLNPYYLGPFLMLLTLLSLGAVAEKNWEKIRAFFAILGASIVGFLIQNLDTLIYAARYGGNHQAVSRDLWWMVKFGLFLPDLFFPRAHQNELMSKISWSLYQSHVPPVLWGESQTVYLGVISAVAVVFMMVSGVALIGARRFEQISPFFWLTSGTLFFSLAGGVNYLLGSFGFLLLRATCRSSILISCMALYFLYEKAPSVGQKGMAFIVISLIGLGIWDHLPRYPAWEEATRQSAWKDYEMDHQFFGDLEKKLPEGAMIFEFPVKDYPEMGPIREMGDYEHFRPVLHTQNLRVSYGTVKGRGDTEWQKRLAAKKPQEMLQELESYGFSAILVNRKAYEDQGESLKTEFLQAGGIPMMENRDFEIIQITPVADKTVPPRK